MEAVSGVIVSPSQESPVLGSSAQNIEHLKPLTITGVVDQITTDSYSLVPPKALPVKRGRGRPPKNKKTNEPSLPAAAPAVKRKRGRPRKNPLPVISSDCSPQPAVNEITAPPQIEKQEKIRETSGGESVSLVEKLAENLAIATALAQSGLAQQQQSVAESSSGGDKHDTPDPSMNMVSTTTTNPPVKLGRLRKRPLDIDTSELNVEDPLIIKRQKEDFTTELFSPKLLQAEKEQQLFSLPECETTKAVVDIALVAGPGSFQDQHTGASSSSPSTSRQDATIQTVVVDLKDQNSSKVEEEEPTVAVPVKRGRGRPRKADSAKKIKPPSASTAPKRGRGRPPKDGVKRGRGRPPKAAAAATSETGVVPLPTVKRGRGRPRKYPLPPSAPPPPLSNTENSNNDTLSTPPKRKRGRPRKSTTFQPIVDNKITDTDGITVLDHTSSSNNEMEREGEPVKRKRGRPRKPRPEGEEGSKQPAEEVKPKRGRGRPRKNPISPRISQLAEKIFLQQRASCGAESTGVPLPSVAGVVIPSPPNNGQTAAAPEKRKRGRPRKYPIPPPKPPGEKRGRGRPRKYPLVVQPEPVKAPCITSPVTMAISDPLESPIRVMDLSPLKKPLPVMPETVPIDTATAIERSGNESFKLHMSFSDSDSEGSEGMGVQDSDIQALADRVVLPSPPPPTLMGLGREREASPLLGSGFEESFDEDSDTETTK